MSLPVLGLSLIVALANPLTASDIDHSPHLAFGRPGAGVTGTNLIARRGYAALHDAMKRTPLWVQYRLVGADLRSAGPRPPWKPDRDLTKGFRAENSDYEGSGFERGHMAANADITKDPESQVETFFLSNVVPQDGDNNGGVWAMLEERGRDYAKEFGEIFVVSGPIFDKPLSDGTIHLRPHIGENQVAVPTYLFRIYLRKSGRGYSALAFEIPNIPIPARSEHRTPAQILAARKPDKSRTGIKGTKADYYAVHGQFLTTIDAIEADSGFNFFNTLPETVQAKFESKKARSVWKP